MVTAGEAKDLGVFAPTICISLIVGAAFGLAPGQIYDHIWLGKWWLVDPMRSGVACRWVKSHYGYRRAAQDLGVFAPTICISLIVGAEVSLGSWAAEWPHMAREMVAGRSYVVWCYTKVVKITVWLQLVRPRTWAVGVPTICISLNA